MNHTFHFGAHQLLRIFFFYLFLTVFKLAASAQRFEFGAGAGLIHYRGDLQSSYFPVKPSAAMEVFFRYNVSMAAVIRGNLMIAPKISGYSYESSDPFQQSSPNPYGFSTYLAELGVFGEYNFFNYRNPKNRFIFGSPYLFGGIGFSAIQSGEEDNFFPDTTYTDPVLNLPLIKNPTAPRISFLPVFVMGVGYKQQLGQFFNLGIQASGRFLFSDGLDQTRDREKTMTRVMNPDGTFALDAQGNYINKPALGRQLGNKADRDSYFYLGLSLSYTIKEVICPYRYEKKQEK